MNKFCLYNMIIVLYKIQKIEEGTRTVNETLFIGATVGEEDSDSYSINYSVSTQNIN